MSGSIELDRDGRHLLIRFPYREDLVDEVRSLPGRRWDKGQKVWRVPATHAEYVVTTFMKHGFAVATDVTAIVAGTASVPAEEETTRGRGPDQANGVAEAAPEDTRPWSVGELNQRVRDALNQAFPGRVQVVGEVIDFDKNKDRRHVFFSLVDKDASGEKVAARVDVALFERTAQRILPELESKGLTLRDGLEILIEARIDLYPATGRYQLVLEDIRPEFTLGKLALTREQILAELGAAGLARRNAELVLPMPCLRIGVLTSPDSDGWNDFLREIEASGIGFSVSLCPVRVQGEGLRPTMLAGLDWFARRAAEFDVLCIVRGGGSRSDLAWFDDREVAFAVARHPLKILCGIGHERDRSVLDEIAYSLKTPTATAAFLVARWQACDELLRERSRRLRDGVREALVGVNRDLAALGERLRRLLNARLVAERHFLGEIARRLVRGAPALLRDRRAAVDSAAQRIAFGTRSLLRGALVELDHRRSRLIGTAHTRLERASATLRTAEARQRLLDPRQVLRRGYALVRDLDTGAILTDARKTSAGRRAEIRLRDGRVTARVEAVTLDATDTPNHDSPSRSPTREHGSPQED